MMPQSRHRGSGSAATPDQRTEIGSSVGSGPLQMSRILPRHHCPRQCTPPSVPRPKPLAASLHPHHASCGTGYRVVLSPIEAPPFAKGATICAVSDSLNLCRYQYLGQEWRGTQTGRLERIGIFRNQCLHHCIITASLPH